MGVYQATLIYVARRKSETLFSVLNFLRDNDREPLQHQKGPKIPQGEINTAKIEGQ